MRRLLDVGVGVLLATAVILLFRRSLTAMVALWDVSPMYSYGYTVPLISGFLLVSRRDDFLRERITPSRGAGALVVLTAVAMLAVGQLAALQVIEQLAFIVLIAGVVLYLFGRAHLQIAAPAVAYLLFMVPMWDGFTEPLHWPFQNNSAKLGVAIMQGIGIPVHREGTMITLPNVLLEVARECSGVNYLIAVTALALPLAWLRLRQNSRRIILIVSSLAVAAVANALRVALIGTLAYLEIGSPLHGPVHVLHGLFVAAAGYVVLFAGLRILQEDDHAAVSSPKPPAIAVGSWRRGEAGGLSAVLLALAFVGVMPHTQNIVLAQPLDTLPVQIGNWTASPSFRPDDKVRSFSGVWSNADERLKRRYRSASGQLVTVEVFYYASQSQDREVISWASSPLHQQSKPTGIAIAGGRQFTANGIDWAASAESGLFWYDLDGKAHAGQLSTKLNTMWRAIRSGRTNGAVVVLRTGTAPAERAALVELAGVLQPALSGLFMRVGD